jgi:hypothetical protein
VHSWTGTGTGSISLTQQQTTHYSTSQESVQQLTQYVTENVLFYPCISLSVSSAGVPGSLYTTGSGTSGTSYECDPVGTSIGLVATPTHSDNQLNSISCTGDVFSGSSDCFALSSRSPAAAGGAVTYGAGALSLFDYTTETAMFYPCIDTVIDPTGATSGGAFYPDTYKTASGGHECQPPGTYVALTAAPANPGDLVATVTCSAPDGGSMCSSGNGYSINDEALDTSSWAVGTWGFGDVVQLTDYVRETALFWPCITFAIYDSSNPGNLGTFTNGQGNTFQCYPEGSAVDFVISPAGTSEVHSVTASSNPLSDNKGGWADGSINGYPSASGQDYTYNNNNFGLTAGTTVYIPAAIGLGDNTTEEAYIYPCVTFTQNYYAAGTPSGADSQNPDCVYPGTKESMTSTFNTGWQFGSWTGYCQVTSGCGAYTGSTAAATTGYVSSAILEKANYWPCVTFTDPDGYGTPVGSYSAIPGESNPTCAPYGSTVQFWPDANPSYNFNQWTGSTPYGGYGAYSGFSSTQNPNANPNYIYFTMPSNPVTEQAAYIPTYSLTLHCTTCAGQQNAAIADLTTGSGINGCSTYWCPYQSDLTLSGISAGDYVDLTVNPASNSYFDGYSGAPGSAFTCGNSKCIEFSMPSSSLTVTAAYGVSAPPTTSIPTYTVTLQCTSSSPCNGQHNIAIADGSLSVNGCRDYRCPSPSSITLTTYSGNTITLTSAPASGWTFAAYLDTSSGAPSGISSCGSSCTFTMPSSSQVITAWYNPPVQTTYSVTLQCSSCSGQQNIAIADESSGGPSVNGCTDFGCPPAYQSSLTLSGVSAGDTVKITSAPASGWTFGGFSGGPTLSSCGNGCATFTMPSSSQTITASYTSQPSCVVQAPPCTWSGRCWTCKSETLTPSIFNNCAQTAGWSPISGNMPILICISTHESGVNAGAYSCSDPNGGSFGLMQVNGIHCGSNPTGNACTSFFDPVSNLAEALTIYRAAGNSFWSSESWEAEYSNCNGMGQ